MSSANVEQAKDNFCSRLIDTFKSCGNISTDAQAAALIPKLGKQNLFRVRQGAIRLTEEQVTWIAGRCGLNKGVCLAKLSAQVAKSDEVKQVWLDVAEKLELSLESKE